MFQAQAGIDECLSEVRPSLLAVRGKQCKFLWRQHVKPGDQVAQRLFDRVIGGGQLESAVKDRRDVHGIRSEVIPLDQSCDCGLYGYPCQCSLAAR